MSSSPTLLFALSTDDRTLHVFDSQDAAISYAEGIDVEAGTWLFFNAGGQALEPVFTKPNKRGWFMVSSGTYYLRLAQNDEWHHLSYYLKEISAVEGNGELSSVEAIKTHLSNTKRR